MARVTIEDCLENVESRFALVHLAVRRVLQLRSGSTTLIETPRNKEIVLALREIAAGKITVDNIRQIEEARPLPAPLPEPAEKAATADLEIKEILEEATAYQPSFEFEEPAQVVEPDQEEI
jgi:DNA-directed RNA polymerase subunit omega